MKMPAQTALLGVILWDLQDSLLFQKELSLNKFPLLSTNSIVFAAYFGFIFLFIFPHPLVLKPKMLVMLRLRINVQALLSPYRQPIFPYCLSSMRCLIRGEEILVQTSCFARKSHQHLFMHASVNTRGAEKILPWISSPNTSN